jgi:plasmid replication initiation protein
MTALTSNNNRLVYQHNNLIRARYRITLDQKRLIIAALSLCNQEENFPNLITVSAKYYSDLYGIKIDSAYGQIKNALDNLYDQSISIVIDDNGTERIGKTRWIYTKLTNENSNEGEVSFQFNPDLKEYLFDINNNFTKYRIRHVLGLKSVYAIRIYELMCQHLEKGSFYLWVSDFRKLFELENKYKMFSEIKKFILNPAMKELNKKSNVNIDFTTEKKGRTVKKIIFNFSEKDQTELEFNK